MEELLMPTYVIDVYLNVTYTNHARLAIFDRERTGPVARQGDILRHAGTLTGDLPDPSAGLEFAFEAANSPADLPHTGAYRSFGQRAVSVGDLVTVSTPGGVLLVSAVCEPAGWLPVSPTDYRLADRTATTYVIWRDTSITGPYTRTELADRFTVVDPDGPDDIVHADLPDALRAAQRRHDATRGAYPAIAVWPTSTGNHALRPLSRRPS
jgi:hypothetical protein